MDPGDEVLVAGRFSDYAGKLRRALPHARARGPRAHGAVRDRLTPADGERPTRDL